MASYFIIVIFLMLSPWQRKLNFDLKKNETISWFGREDLRDADPIRIKIMLPESRNKMEHISRYWQNLLNRE